MIISTPLFYTTANLKVTNYKPTTLKLTFKKTLLYYFLFEESSGTIMLRNVKNFSQNKE